MIFANAIPRIKESFYTLNFTLHLIEPPSYLYTLLQVRFCQMPVYPPTQASHVASNIYEQNSLSSYAQGKTESHTSVLILALPRHCYVFLHALYIRSQLRGNTAESEGFC